QREWGSNTRPHNEKALRRIRRRAYFEEKSGRHDLNMRPLRPERSALARLSYAPRVFDKLRILPACRRGSTPTCAGGACRNSSTVIQRTIEVERVGIVASAL